MKKTIVITGASQRIGLFLSGYLLSLDYEVVAIVRKASKELQALQSLNKETLKIITKDLIQSTIDIDFWRGLGKFELAGFVHCASVFKHDTIENCSTEILKEHQIINCNTFVDACTSYCQYKKHYTGKPASFISFLDAKIDDLNVDHYSYTISKLNLKSNIPFLAMNGAPKIRVNAISPGLTLRSGEQTIEDFERAQASLPYGFGSTIEDIAQTTAFLLMMPSINGQIITVDAGQHLRKERDIIFK